MRYMIDASQRVAINCWKRDNRSDTELLHDDSGTPWLDVQKNIHCCVQTYNLTNGIRPPTLTCLFTPFTPSHRLGKSSSDHLRILITIDQRQTLSFLIAISQLQRKRIGKCCLLTFKINNHYLPSKMHGKESQSL